MEAILQKIAEDLNKNNPNKDALNDIFGDIKTNKRKTKIKRKKMKGGATPTPIRVSSRKPKKPFGVSAPSYTGLTKPVPKPTPIRVKPAVSDVKPIKASVPKPIPIHVKPSVSDVKPPPAHKSMAKRILYMILKGVFAIVAFSLVYVVYKSYSMYNTTMANKAKIQSNWPTYRCQPQILPLAGIVGPPGTSAIENGLECAMTFFKNSFLKFMTPFIDFFEQIVLVLVDLVESVQNIRKMFNYLRDSIRSFLLDIANMFYAYAKKLSYLFNRLMDTFSKVFRVFEDLFYALGYAIYTVASLWNSPVGGVARFFCLRKDTPITMKDGSEKPVCEIKVGDKVKKGGKVLAVHLFSGKNVQMYLYKNKLVVASSHLILEDGKWIRMKDSKYAKPLDKGEKEIYCLSTKKGKIFIKGNLFADYMETETPEQMTYILNIIMEHLNNKPSNLTGKNEKVWGFQKDTLVLLKSGITKKIKDLKLGDNLGNNNIVEGVTKIYGRNVKLFNHNGTVCSGNVIVRNNNKWKLIKDIGKPLKKKKSVLYHVFTTGGEITINNNLCKDYEIYKDYDQVKYEDINDRIDEYVESELNKI